MTTKISEQYPQPPLLNASETARYLGISKATVYRMVQRGQIPSIHAGRAVRFCLPDVLNALSSHVDETRTQ